MSAITEGAVLLASQTIPDTRPFESETTCISIVSWTDALMRDWVLVSGSTFDAVMTGAEWDALKDILQSGA